MQYEWRQRAYGVVKSLDPNVVGTYITSMIARASEQDRPLTPQDMVDDAMRPDSPLHTILEWDDHRAAELFRRRQARYAAAALMVKREKPTDVQTRAFVYVAMTDGQGRRMVPLALAMRKPKLRGQLLDNGVRELERFCTRYSAFPEFDLVIQILKKRVLSDTARAERVRGNASAEIGTDVRGEVPV